MTEVIPAGLALLVDALRAAQPRSPADGGADHEVIPAGLGLLGEAGVRPFLVGPRRDHDECLGRALAVERADEALY